MTYNAKTLFMLPLRITFEAPLMFWMLLVLILGTAAIDLVQRVALRYTADINGSQNNIAGICDSTGRLFGLMPHPERYLDWTRHPAWTRLDSTTRAGTTPGRLMFESAVAAVRNTHAGV